MFRTRYRDGVSEQRAEQPADDPDVPPDEQVGAPPTGAPAADRTPTAASRVAGALVAAQGVVVLAAAVFYLVEAVTSQASSVRNVAMAVLLFLLMGGGLLLVARDLVPRRRWARAPAITWEVICLPVAYGLFQSGRWYAGLPVALVAAVVLVAVLVSAPSD
jgi:hypothetical protein